MMDDIETMAKSSQESRADTRGKSMRLAMDNSVYEPFEESKASGGG